MRHKRSYRKFGRTPDHRRAMFRNLATSLISHERIVTTYHKALEMRPWIEKLIHKARSEDKINSHRYINSILYTTSSQKKLTREIVPRMDDLEIKAGFTRIEPIGQRKPDRAKMALIELIGNPIAKWEKQQDLEAAEEFGKPTYWDWELKVLRQEQQYFKNLLDNLQDQIEQEIDQIVTQEENTLNDELRKDIEQKYENKQKFLLQGLKRAIIEEEIHLKQETLPRYKYLDSQYGQSEDWDMTSLFSPGKPSKSAL